MRSYKNNLKNYKSWLVILVLNICVLNLTGCATTVYNAPSAAPKGLAGVYHKVEKGQTLWKISKMYQADLDEIAGINHISDASSIEVGQLIFIPSQLKQAASCVQYPGDDFIWPVKGRVIAGFGQTFNNMVNKGINIQPYSNPDVVAVRSGKVVFYADNLGPFGKTIIIEHDEGFSTVYARNSQVFIKPGDNVQKGAVIAKAGSAGRDKNTYLHFEVRKGYISKNPSFYLP